MCVCTLKTSNASLDISIYCRIIRLSNDNLIEISNRRLRKDDLLKIIHLKVIINFTNINAIKKWILYHFVQLLPNDLIHHKKLLLLPRIR